MTRNEFLDDVNTWDKLFDVCNDYDCDLLSGVYSEDSRDDCLEECLVDMARNNTWRDLWRILDEIPDGYDYYREDGYGGWEGLDDSDFDGYKDDVIGWMDSRDLWDPEEEEDDEENQIDDEPEDMEDNPEPQEEMPPIGELFSGCQETFNTILCEQKAAVARAEQEFANYIGQSGIRISQ